jgi:hypothetical protein
LHIVYCYIYRTRCGRTNIIYHISQLGSKWSRIWCWVLWMVSWYVKFKLHLICSILTMLYHKDQHTIRMYFDKRKQIARCRTNSKILIGKLYKDSLNIHLHDHSLSWLGTDTSIKSGLVKLIDVALLIQTRYKSLISILSFIINNELFSFKRYVITNW